jgi:hypothetical protein
MRKTVIPLPAAWICALALGACVGTIGPGESTPGDPGAEPDPGSPGGAAAASGACRVSFPLRRLTEVQYRNAIRDLFKGQVVASAQFPAGELGASRSGFSTEPDANLVTLLGAEKVLDAADEVALAVADKLPAVLPCAASAPGETCAARLIDDLGPRAYRRPLTADERGKLLAVYRRATGPSAFQDGVALVVDTILQAAPFLYIVETGKPVPGAAGVVELSDYEVAARLAFLLWDSLPDAALLQAASKGGLRSGKDLRAQAERMFADPRARATIARFAREWTRLHVWKPGDKVAREFNDVLATGMQTEFDLFMQGAFLQPGGTLTTLLTSPLTYANASMAAFYGVPPGAGAPADFRPVTLDGRSRAGLLTLPAFLSSAAHSDEPSYVQRGVFVLENLLCRDLPTPPPDAAQRQPDFPARATQRQKSAAIRAVAECGVCHASIDPIGLGFDAYDEIGRVRMTLPGGTPVDGQGELRLGAPDLDGTFNGPVELASKLAGSKDVERCLARQWLRFAASRLDGAPDSCAVDHLVGSMSSSGQSLREMILAFTGADEFRFRRLGGTP